ncbi:MAG: LytTR family DNA-binding domain-containing protein [Tannerellaceae bacterium]|jgi:DNA-binding LytR/AlgR family response regulator|nr:LytTR family DNA-binding domain-containing protein [Tannerellaceae bacterium]
MTLSCLIVDDEPPAVALLESYVLRTPFLRLAGSYNSAVQAAAYIAQESIDLLLLDIQMPEVNGMELSRMAGGDTRVIFTTAFGQYALDSYKLNALDYLLKPISYADFLQSASKALRWHEMLRASREGGASENRSIFVKSEHKLIQLEFSSILYIESLKDYVLIHTEANAQPISSLTALQTMEGALPSDVFVRVHRSFIVNMDKIKVIENNRIVFGKVYIPISDTYRRRFTELLNQRSPFFKG